MRVLKEHSILSVFNNMLVDYKSPVNITYFWNFGSLAGLFLGIQLLTGIFLAMHYAAQVDIAFIGVEHIMRDVNNGWLLRYLHANGASFFFVVLYCHMFRGLYYGSYTYPRVLPWSIGVTIFILTMGTAFLGYVLPWGQMSFWGATVITNLVSAVPVVGKDIVYWLWGGFSVDNATLNRFFSLHYLLPFVITGLAFLHLITLHDFLSNNPLGVASNRNHIPFHPYFTVKDIFGVFFIFFFYLFFVFFMPNYLGHPDNYILANPLVTPPHIVPEWYFLPFYAILRSIPSKLGGVVAMGLSLLVLYVLPLIHSSSRRALSFRPLLRPFFWFFVLSCLVLGWIGGSPIQPPYYEIGQVAGVYYFVYLLLIHRVRF